MKQYIIETGMGKTYDNLPFLDENQLKEFNNIGYCSKMLDGTPMDRYTYLNSLNKGKFTIRQIGFDSGDFIEKFIITHHIIVENNLLEKALDEYIKSMKNQDECSGFIDGFKKAIELINKNEL